MTKKEYFKPTTLIMLFQQSECILGTSGEITADGVTAVVEVPNEEYNGVFNSRHNSVWDED